MSTTKGVPLKRDEVALLVDLVEANKIITSKATNASNNILKEAAWAEVTDAFNASVSSCPRRTEQLKIKWDNLKKCTRKRSTIIRMNQIKTGGGKPDYIPPDDVLDRVASMLGATCEGYSVPFGGDAEVSQNPPSPSPMTICISRSSITIGEGDKGIVINKGDSERNRAKEKNKLPAEIPKPRRKFFFNTPSGSGAKQKRKLLDEDIKIRNERNKAITNYYTMKTKKVELEIELLNRQLEHNKH